MKNKNWRINFIFISVLLIAFVLLIRLFYIQVLNQSFYSALAKGQQQWFIEAQGKRGEIFTQDKRILATNTAKSLVYLRIEELEDKEKTARILGEILGQDESFILQRINEQGYGRQFLKDNLSEKRLGKLEEKNLPGVHIMEQITRIYPRGKRAAQVIGFLGGEGKGQYGVEGFHEPILQGKAGWLSGRRNPWGFSLGIGVNDIRQGADLVLTLDYDIQEMAESLLKRAEEDLGIRSGQILVKEPTTGRILALANFPSFDLNKFYKIEDKKIFKNAILQKAFEPGSVLKPFSMAIALEQGKITPETTFVDQGFVQIGNHFIRNFADKVWGEKTMTQVLINSINTGVIFVQEKIGAENFLRYFEKFGFFEPTNIDLQGEVVLENRILRKGRRINLATASFGQGIKITPIQLARAFGAIINDGKLVRPYIVEKIIQPDGKIIRTKPEIQRENIISPKTANRLTAMLVSAIEETPFVNRAKIPGYYIAGKTGTAQVSYAALGIPKAGYSEETIQSFIGFFPAFDPQFLILVKLDNPASRSAEFSAAPIFRKLAKHIINRWHIPPDY